MIHYNKFLPGAALFLFAFIFALGCKPDSGRKEGTSPAGNNTVTIRQEKEPEGLNPVFATTGYASDVFQHIFYPLMEYNPISLEFDPIIVKSAAEINTIEEGEYSGGFAYTYEILDEAVWDNGSPITGHDYVFTLKAIFNPRVAAATYRGLLSFIKDVEIDPQNSKKFTVYTHPAFQLGWFYTSNFSIYPEYVFDANGLMKDFALKDLNDEKKVEEIAKTDPKVQQFADEFQQEKFMRDPGFVSGCGPYKLVEWNTGQGITLQKKENWWGDRSQNDNGMLTALPDKLIFVPTPDNATAVAQLKGQEIDVLNAPPSKTFVDLMDNELAKQNYNFLLPEFDVIYFLYLNNKSPFLSDKRVRRALAHSFDTERGMEEILFRLGKPVIGPVHPMRPYYHKELSPIPFSIEKARELLQAAGWEDTDGDGIADKVINGEKQNLSLRYFIDPGRGEIGFQIGILLKENARKAGIDIQIINKDFGVAIKNHLRPRDYEIFPSRSRRSPLPYDPYQRWHSSNDRPDGSNHCSFGTAESDAVIEALRVESDKTKRDSLYKKFQEIIYEEQPAIFLFAPKSWVAVHKRFEAKPSSRRPGFFPQLFKLRE